MSTRLLLLAFVFALSGCQKITEADQQSAIECVKANVAALQKGDVNGVLATTHPNSEAYVWTPELVKAIVEKYKLTFELEELRIEQVTAEGIQVHFVQVTKKLEGPDDFLDNRAEGIHVLKRDGKAWKIWFTRFLQTRTLDGQPLPQSRPLVEDSTPPPTETPSSPAPPAAAAPPTDSQSATPPEPRP